MKLHKTFGLFTALSCGFSLANGASVTVTNPSPDDWADAPIVVKWQEGMPGEKGKLITAKSGSETLPVQVDDLDADGTLDELVFVTALKAGESKTFELLPDPPATAPASRSHTGMYLKNAEIKGMEGPGWETDLIAFRMYWDKRNATDVFCKVKPILSLEKFAEKGHDYHRESPYGMDVLKVGDAVGIGGFGAWIDGKVVKASDAKREFRIAADGPIRAACDFDYTDWKAADRKLSLHVRMHVFAGQDWAEGELTLKAEDSKEVPLPIAGFVKHTTTTLVQNKELGVVGRWGKQALGSGEVPGSANLGLGIVAEPATIAEQREDAVNTFLVLNPVDGTATYRYNANWEKEPKAATSPEEYQAMLEKIARKRPQIKVK